MEHVSTQKSEVSELVEPYYPTAVIQITKRYVTVGIEFSAQERYATEMLDASVGQDATVLKAVGNLADIGRMLGTSVLVRISDTRLADLVRAVAGNPGPSPVLVATGANRQMIRLYSDIAVSHNQVKAPREAVARPATLVIGTDGSSDRRQGVWSYVTEDGRTAWGRAPVSAIAVCELFAIDRAIRDAGKRDVLVLTDSQPALSALRQGGTTKALNSVEDRVRRAVAERLRKGYVTTVAWIPGHAGIGLNEAAHRVALNALRQVRFGTESAVVGDVVRRIVTDLKGEPVPALDPYWTLRFSWKDEPVNGYGAGNVACLRGEPDASLGVAV